MTFKSLMLFIALSWAAAPICAQQVEPLPPIEDAPSPSDKPVDAGKADAKKTDAGKSDPGKTDATKTLIGDGIIVEDDAPPPKLWSGSFDLGLNGSEGNSQLFNFRFNILAERTTPDNHLTLKVNYVDSVTKEVQTANRLFFDGRDEIPFEDSPWSLYVHETTEYDEFKAFDLRLTVDSGVGYQFVKTDITSFIGRIGPGISREIGGPDDRFLPELVSGIAFERKLTKHQTLQLSADYFPDITDFANYRINSTATWAIVIDEENNLSLKLSAVDRYDSTPGGKLPNDLDYAATLLWSF